MPKKLPGTICIDSIILADGDTVPTGDAVESLAASISEVGLINPITVTPDNRLIAGRHRYVACRTLGWTDIPATVVDLDGLREELVTIDENLRRKKFTVLDEAQLLARRKEVYLALHPDVRHGGRRTPSGHNGHLGTPSFSQDLASKTGSSARTIRRVTFIGERLDPKAADLLRGHAASDNALELVRLAHLEPKSQRAAALAVVNRKVSLGAAIRDAEWKSKVTSSVEGVADDHYRLHHGDFFEVGSREVADKSVDLVLTDPPWDREFVPRLADLAKLAARVLKPGCPCLVLTGQLRMPDVLRAFDGTLRYTWTLAYLTAEKASPPGKMAASGWLPLLFFVAPGYDRIGGVGEDVIREVGGDGPRLHPWQKDDVVLRQVIEMFSGAADLVFDPFLGSGTTGVAALQAGRRFVGIDIDADAVRLASDRLAGVGWGSGGRATA
jgi:ParB family chromosome partitioning protein